MRSRLHVAAVAMLSTALTLAPAERAAGQLLQLGAPEAPAAGTGIAAVDLADYLEAEGSRRSQADDARERVIGRLMLVAADLARTGERLGPEGSGHVVAAFRLAADLDDIERVLGSTSDLGDVDIALLSRRLHALLGSLDEDPENGVRRVGHALAPLIEAANPPPDNADARAKLAGLVFPSESPWPELRASLEVSLGRATRAETAAALLEPIEFILAWYQAVPFWIDRRAYDLLRVAVDEAIRSLLGPADGEDPLETLRRVHVMLRCIADVDSMERTGPVAELRTLISTSISRDGMGRGDGWEALRHALDALTTPTPDVRRIEIVRQLRPAIRPLSLELIEARDALIDALPTIYAGGGSMTDPATLAPLNRARDAAAAIHALESISLWIGDDAQDRSSPAGRIADRLLPLAQAAGGKDAARATGSLLRSLADDSARFREFPGEASLRAVVEAPSTLLPMESDRWSELTRGGPDVVLAQIESARSAWLAAWADPDAADVRDATQTMEALRGALLLADALEPLATAPMLRDAVRSANSVAGWFVRPEAIDRIIDNHAIRLQRVFDAIAEGDMGLLRARTAEFRDDYAAAMLFSRLAGLAEAPLPSRTASRSPASLRPGVWTRSNGHIAEVARYSAEYHAASVLNLDDRAAQLRKYTEFSAKRAIQSLDRTTAEGL